KWLENKPIEQQLDRAIELQERFALQPSSFTDAELAAKAVPSWVREEVTFSPDWLRALQSEPKPWLRAKPGHGPELIRKLGHARSAVPLSHPTRRASRLAQRVGEGAGVRAALADTLEYLGESDLFRTPEFHAGEFEIQD